MSKGRWRGGSVPWGKTLGPVAANSPGLRGVDWQKTGRFLPHGAAAQLWELLSNDPAGMSPWPSEQLSSRSWFFHLLQEQTWGHHWDHRSLLQIAHWDRGRHKEWAVITSIAPAFLGSWDEGSQVRHWVMHCCKMPQGTCYPHGLLETWPFREVQPNSLYLLYIITSFLSL